MPFSRLMTAAAAALITLSPLSASAEGESHAFEIGGLEIVHPWTRATKGPEALIFMELHNEGAQAVTLRGAKMEDGGMAQLVGFVLKDGNEAYEAVPEIPVAPGTELDLSPGALALQVSDLSEPLEKGDHLEIVLITSAGEVEIDVAVEKAGATQHSHAGHSH